MEKKFNNRHKNGYLTSIRQHENNHKTYRYRKSNIHRKISFPFAQFWPGQVPTF